MSQSSESAHFPPDDISPNSANLQLPSEDMDASDISPELLARLAAADSANSSTRDDFDSSSDPNAAAALARIARYESNIESVTGPSTVTPESQQKLLAYLRRGQGELPDAGMAAFQS